MLLVYAILVVLMLVCGAFLACKGTVLELFTMQEISEQDVIQSYANILQRQPSGKELVDALTKIRAKELTIGDLEGRLMDSDEYQRMIKMQSNALTPELDKLIHERKQLAYISDVYFGAFMENIKPELLMPIRDIYIHLEYNETALRMVFDDAKYAAFQTRLLNEFQLSKEKTLRMFDETFDKKSLLQRAKDAKVEVVATNLNDPPLLTRIHDAGVNDTKTSGTVTHATIAKDPVKKEETIVPVEKFTDFAASEPIGAVPKSTIHRTVHDKDSSSEQSMFDIDQRAKNIFDIHKVAQKLDDTPDAFVYVPTIPVRYASPITHFEEKPPGNTDPFVVDLYGCMKGAPVRI